MDCEATSRAVSVCPPLVGIARLEGLAQRDAREEQKLIALRVEAKNL